MGNRRTAIPVAIVPPTSIERRLASAASPQWAQTGAQTSTNDGSFNNLVVLGTEKVAILAVGSSFSVQSSGLKSMAFQSATLVGITGGSVSAVTSTSLLVTGSSINSTPIGLSSASTGKFSELYSSAGAFLNSITSTAVSFTGGFIGGISATGIVLSGSSWQSGPVSSTAISSSNASLTGGLLSGLGATSISLSGSSVSGSVISGSSINSTPIGLSSQSTGKFTELSASSAGITNLTVTGTISFGTFVSDVVAAILGYVQIQTATGGIVRLAAVAT